MLSTPTGDAYAINKVLTSHVNRVLPGYFARLLLITPITQSKEKPQQAPRNTFEYIFPGLGGAFGVIKTRSARIAAVSLAFKYRCGFTLSIL